MSKIVDALELALRLSAQTNDEFTAHDRALIESALAEARAAVSAEPVVWSEADIASMRVAFSKRFNDPIPRTETLMGVAAVGYRKALGLDPVLNLSAPPPVEASQQQADEVSEEYTAGYLAGWRSAKRGDSVPPKQRGQAGREVSDA